jgi:hypothetical protein
LTAGAGPEPTLALEPGETGGFVVTGAAFRPGERVRVIVHPAGATQETSADHDGAFRAEFRPLPPPRGALWLTAIGNRGSRATLVLDRPHRLHC